MDGILDGELGKIAASGMKRAMLNLVPISGPRVMYEGRECVLFCSNDYLNLSDHPSVKAAAVRALEKYGIGSPSSRMISGNLDIHEALEERIAAFKGRKAVLFPTGYMANIGLLDSLAGDGDAIYSDELNHASIIDACRLSRARTFIYPHLDAAALERKLSEGAGFRRRVIVTDAVFSMDGDVAPLPDLRGVADRCRAWLVLDEAHATGVLGRTGRGIEEEFGLEGASDAIVGTLGKALGGAGGFVAGSATLAELMRNRARTFIYTTAPPPALCAGLIEALAILDGNPAMVAELRGKSLEFRNLLKSRGVKAPDGDTPIVPVVIGDSGKTMAAAERMRHAGYIVTGIRPPTVAKGSARIRATVTLGHSRADMEGFADALADAIGK